MAFKITWTIGQELDGNGRPITELQTRLNIALDRITMVYGALTVEDARGRWTDPKSQTLVMERSIVITVILADDSITSQSAHIGAHCMGEFLARTFSQTSVMTIVEPLHDGVEFVSADDMALPIPVQPITSHGQQPTVYSKPTALWNSSESLPW